MKKRHLWGSGLAAVFLVFLVFGAIFFYYTFASPVTAQVRLSPKVKHLQQYSTLTIVPNHTRTIQLSSPEARLLSATDKHTLTQKATGQGYADPAVASGMIAMTWVYIAGTPLGPLTTDAGDRWTGTNGITIIVDRTTSVYLGGTVSFPAHVSSPGSYGNMPAYRFSLKTTRVNGQIIVLQFTNSTAFTGGQDGGAYSYVQKQDITNGEQAVRPTVLQNALAGLNTKRLAGETWAQPPVCTSTFSVNAAINDRVPTFQIIATGTCSGETYDVQEEQKLAAQNLTTLARNTLSEEYELSGMIATTVTHVQVQDKRGTLMVSLTSSGTWVYRFSSAENTRLVHLISGKSAGDAQKVLLQQTSVEQATVTVVHGFWFWNAVPTDLTKIRITIVPASEG